MPTQAMPSPLHLEDLQPGQLHRSSGDPVSVTAEGIKAFARQFDPQPFHLDEATAALTFFKGLAASGWHTAAMTMKLLVEGGLPLAGGIIGAGVEEVRWPRPVRPGDQLRVENEVLEVRPLAVAPGSGVGENPDHYAQSERRAGSGHDVQSGGAAANNCGNMTV